MTVQQWQKYERTCMKINGMHEPGSCIVVLLFFVVFVVLAGVRAYVDAALCLRRCDLARMCCVLAETMGCGCLPKAVFAAGVLYKYVLCVRLWFRRFLGAAFCACHLSVCPVLSRLVWVRFCLRVGVFMPRR